MRALKIALYALSGLLLIAGMACLAIFYHNGSIEAVGAAMMFLCFGGAGIITAVFAPQIMGLVKPNGRRSA